MGNLNSYAHSASEAHWSSNGSSVYVTPDELCPLGCETPRINYDVYNGKPYRYFYAISSDVDAENPGTVSKPTRRLPFAQLPSFNDFLLTAFF